MKETIPRVFEEPGCDKNTGKSEKERKKGCTKQLTPGAAAGGCAFDGAKIALQPIVDVAHLVHGPIACEGNSWDNRHSASSGSTIYRTGFTTDINEMDVIYGAEKRLFKAIREDKASVVTGVIRKVTKDGIELTDGRKLEADVIVTATGLRLATLGKVKVSLDGQPVDVAQSFWYRNCMFSNLPNLAVSFGYLNTSWTQRVGIVTDYLCRLFKHMDKWGVQVVTPVLPADHGLEEYQPVDLFSSGYLQRGKHLIPKSATTAPWRLHMFYREDRKEMAEAQIDDGWLQFERRREKVAA